MKSLGVGALGLALMVAVSACGSDSSTTPAPTAPTMTETLGGVVPAQVGGVPQSSFIKFTVVQSGTVQFQVLKATEFYPSGAIDATVFVGLALGSLDSTGTICTPTTAVLPVQAGFVSAAGTIGAGPVCLQVSDVTGQGGQVDYTIVVAHS